MGGPVHASLPRCPATIPPGPHQRGAGGTADGEGGFEGNANVFSQDDDDPAIHGTGNNRFAIRIKGARRAATAVSGFEHMEMYANYSNGSVGATSTFNLVRVVPAAATKTLRIGFFDTGDARNPAR